MIEDTSLKMTSSVESDRQHRTGAVSPAGESSWRFDWREIPQGDVLRSRKARSYVREQRARMKED
jgi:hypothetical protein